MPAWLIKLLPFISDKILDLLQGYIVDALASFIAKVKNAKRAKSQEAAKKVMDKVNADPNSKPDERAKAYEDYIGSGN